MPKLSRRKFCTLGALAGAVTLSGCATRITDGESPPPGAANTKGDATGTTDIPSEQNPTDSTDNTSEDGDADTLGISHTKSETTFSTDEEANSGWVHIVADGESFDLTFDARLCGALSHDTEVTLTNPSSSDYVLGITTNQPSDNTTSNTSKSTPVCDSGVRLIGGANVPNDWETLKVTVNGDKIQTVKRSGTTPKLRPLPDPIPR